MASMASPPKMDIPVQHEIHPRTILKQADQTYVKDTSKRIPPPLTASPYIASSEHPLLRQNCWGK
jgi:hypothetical protein